MRKTLIILLAVALAFLACGVLTYHWVLGIDWLDAVYFALTNDGYHDFGVNRAAWPIRLLSIALMLSSAGALALVFGLVADTIFHLNLEEVLGRRRLRMSGHIVLCGLGNVGFRILEHLRRMGEDVIVVDSRAESKNLPLARSMGVGVVVGDVRLAQTLEQANVAKAKCLIAATNDDLANLEAGLNARKACPDCRIILRIFDQNLANKLRDGFEIHTAFSTSALAAPAFAMATLHKSVKGSFYVGEDLMLTVEIHCEAGSRLDGMTVDDFMAEGRFAVLAHQAAATGLRSLNPSDPKLRFAPGDLLVIASPREDLARLHEINAGAARSMVS